MLCAINSRDCNCSEAGPGYCCTPALYIYRHKGEEQSGENDPKSTIIVICYRMPTQVANTIRALAAGYQRGIRQDDYEVIVVENCSDQQLSEAEIGSLPENFRYILRQGSSPSPAAAINHGFALARGAFIGLMIDGAYLLTPGVLRYALLAYHSDPEAFVTVPTYHLGPVPGYNLYPGL